jgi:hypothetical protein
MSLINNYSQVAMVAKPNIDHEHGQAAMLAKPNNYIVLQTFRGRHPGKIIMKANIPNNHRSP